MNARICDLQFTDPHRARRVRDRITNVLHTSRTLTDMRTGLVALLGDITDANGLEPTAEERMASTLRSVAPYEVAPDTEQAPSTDRCSSLGLEFGVEP